jgi:hypothetical protein
VTAITNLLFDYPIMFWTPLVDVQSPKPALGGLGSQYFWIAVVQENDAAYDKLTMELCTSHVGGGWVREGGWLCCSREIDGHSLPVSAIIFACMLELIASRMQSVISTKS